jgi:HAD superfamily hydrolase (TIGR01484 family)
MERIGIFFDFDGTLSPLNVCRDDARVRDDVAEVLKELVKYYVVAIVSSKDCYFLRSRTPYISNYVCINGLEILTNDYVVNDSAVLREDLVRALEDVYSLAKKLENVYVEGKRSLLGPLLGVSIDWRGFEGVPKGLEEVVEVATSKGLNVINYRYNPFVDIYISKRDKGEGVKVLRSLLNLGKLIYVGDGENDIPAFKLADISVLVRHEFNQELKVGVNFEVRFEELSRWLVNHVLTGRLL